MHERGAVPPEPQVQLVAFATLLPLGDAISWVKRYSDVYKHKYPSSFVEFALVSVSSIDALTAEELSEADVQLVESLPQAVESF